MHTVYIVELVHALDIQDIFSILSHIYFTEFGAALKTVLPVLLKYCYKYCYSDSRRL